MDQYEEWLTAQLKNVSELREKAFAFRDWDAKTKYSAMKEAFKMALDEYRGHVAEMEQAEEQERHLREDFYRGQL